MLQIIKDRVSLRDAFESFGVRVKGRTAICPFHEDRRPSITFKEHGKDTGLWYCFVCGLGGDLITFTMKLKGMSFKDTLSFLNEHFSLGLTPGKPPKRNFYLESIDENYQALKDSIKAEMESLYARQYEINALNRSRHYPTLFYTAKDHNFEYLDDDKLDNLDSQLRELENARYKLRRTATQIN